MKALIRDAAAGFLAVACVSAALVADASQATPVVVAVVEPSSSKGKADPGFSVSFGVDKASTTPAILKGFQSHPGEQLVLLVRNDVSLATVGIVSTMATKATWLPEKISVFVFSADRRGMWRLPGFRDMPFSEDPMAFQTLLVAPATAR